MRATKTQRARKGGPVNVVADDFVVSGSPVQVEQVLVWGLYLRTNTPGSDSFTVVFHGDTAGLPGPNAAPAETNVPNVRVATGRVAFSGLNEYMFTLSLASPVTLSPGTYWVEVFNDLSGDTWCWQVGELDASVGIPNLASSPTTGVPG